MLKIERPTDKHLRAVQAKFVVCHGDDSPTGHFVWKWGDLWWMVGRGWLCGQHKAEGKAEQAARMARWRAHRDSIAL